MTDKKKPAYLFWTAVYGSAALVGAGIMGVVPWWAFIVPWIIYGGLVFLFLGFVFLNAFIAVILDDMEKRKSK